MDGEITKDQALKAYNTIRDYCSMQGNCDDCLFRLSEDNEFGECIMEVQDVPRGWDVLDLD